MNTSFEDGYLREMGFTDFIHLRKTQRDRIKRMAWMQIVNEEIVTLRIAFVNKKWVIDYISPEKYIKKLETINEAIKFITYLRDM
jgi:hypothetical protein